MQIVIGAICAVEWVNVRIAKSRIALEIHLVVDGNPGLGNSGYIWIAPHSSFFCQLSFFQTVLVPGSIVGQNLGTNRPLMMIKSFLSPVTKLGWSVLFYNRCDLQVIKKTYVLSFITRVINKLYNVIYFRCILCDDLLVLEIYQMYLYNK